MIERKYTLFLFSSLLLFLSTISIFLENIYVGSTLKIILFILLLSLVIFSLRKDNEVYLSNQWFKHSVIFLLGYCIVHFQLYFDVFLNDLSPSDPFLFINRNVVIKSALISLIGLLSFFVGYLYYRDTSSRNIVKRGILPKVRNPFVLTGISFIALFVFIVTTDRNYFNGGYLEYYSSNKSPSPFFSYLIMLIEALLHSIIIQVSYNLRKASRCSSSFSQYVLKMGLGNLAILLYVILMMCAGDRGPVLTLCLGYFAGFIYVSQMKVKLHVFMLCTILGGLSITLLGVVRNADSGLTFSQRLAISIVEDKKHGYLVDTFSPLTYELASSVRTVQISANNIPEKYSYRYGQFQLNQLMSVIPGLSGLIDEIVVTPQKYRTSADYITWLSEGKNADSGAGSSCVADLYLDFGLWGVIIGMLLFGFLLRRCERGWCGRQEISLFSLCLSYYFLINALYISRSSILATLRPVILIFVVLYLYEYIKFKRKLI